MNLPPDYTQPATKRHLADSLGAHPEYLRIKIRVSLSQTFARTFEEGAQRLLDEVGPRPGAGPREGYRRDAVILTQCDPEETLLPDTVRGILEFGINAHALPDDAGIPLFLAIASYLAVFSFVLEYVLLDINIPEPLLEASHYMGPRYGPECLGPEAMPRLGMIIKPRFLTDKAFLVSLIRSAADGGVDYISDDELTVGDSALPYEKRLALVTETLADVERSTGRRPGYIANITGASAGARHRASLAHRFGVTAVMVNTFTMGHDLTAELASAGDFQPAVVANALGLGPLTRSSFRVATELVVRLARLAGADAVYTGPFVGLLHSAEHSVLQLRRALTQPYSITCSRRPAAAVLSGGVGLPEIIQNCRLYNGPIFISMGYQMSEYLAQGHSCALLMECIRTLATTVLADGPEAGRRSVERLARKGGKYRACLKAIRAEEAVSF